MHFQKRAFQVIAAILASASVSYGDAYATGDSVVSGVLYNVGTNGNGGTGSQIVETLFSVYNANFLVANSGPGSESQSIGNGIIDGGNDGGSGMGWSYFGENNTSGTSSENIGFSDASNTFGTTNMATEDTYNELVFEITNTSATTNEWFDLQITNGVYAEVTLDNSTQEFGEDEALQQYGYTNDQGSFTGNTSTNEAYAFTGDGFGMGLGTDTFAFVQNDLTNYYAALLAPGQTLYLGVVTENFSQVGAATVPAPGAVVPFAMGLLALRKRRK